MPKAYSYLRFSSAGQSLGDSERRQWEAAVEYADKHGLDLDSSITFKDLGVSAYHGHNIRDGGALARFLHAVQSGQIERGSYLLVEAFDRLSRRPVNEAAEQFLSLINAGIVVVTLRDGKAHASGSTSAFTDLLLSLVAMQTAHEESAKKSERLLAKWEQRRKEAQEHGKVMPGDLPAWLRKDKGTGQVVLVEAKAKVVRRVFSLYLDGFGIGKIASILNDEGIPRLSTRGKGTAWHESYVARLLSDGRAKGEYQPKRRTVDEQTGKRVNVPDGQPIPDYYPAAVPPDVFNRAASRRASVREQEGHNAGGRGRRGTHFSNLFMGLVVCSDCGQSLRYKNKGRPPRGFVYLSCHWCKGRPNTRYEWAEPAILSALSRLDLSPLVAGHSSQTAKEREALEEQQASLQATQQDAQRKRERLANTLEDAEGEPDDYLLSRIKEHSATIKETEGKLETIEGKLAALNHAEQESHQVAGDFHVLLAQVIQQMQQAPEDADGALSTYDLRQRLNSMMKQYISRIEIDTTSLPKADGQVAVIHFQAGADGQDTHTKRVLIPPKGQGLNMDALSSIENVTRVK